MECSCILPAIRPDEVIANGHKFALAQTFRFWEVATSMRGLFFWSLAALALVSCREEAHEETRSPVSATPLPPRGTPPGTPSGTPPDTAATLLATPRGARSVAEETDTFLFEYAYPQPPGDIPELAAWLDRRLEQEREKLANEADRAREAARNDGFPFNKFSSETQWQVVADLPDYLSLSAALSTYTGGAHPNYGFDATIWDKASGKALEPMSLFTSAGALDRALGRQLCDALNAERAKRRGTEIAEGSDEGFDACVKPDETNLLLGSRSGRKFDRVGVRIAPYIAGPYVEGAYEFTFDVTPAVLATVRPEYRDAFAARN